MLIRNFFIILFCTASILKAQNKLIIISENGEPFWLYINQEKVNDSALVIAKSGKVVEDSCSVIIKFTDKKIAEVNSSVVLLQNGKKCENLEFTYAIETTKKGRELKFISIDSANKSTQASNHVKDFLLNFREEQNVKNKLTENYPAPITCTKTISDSLLERQIKTLQNNHIELNRVKDAKWFISNNCLSISQLEKVFTAFDYDDSKVQLAKFGYDYFIDKENFLNILTSIKYKSEKEELKTFYTEKTKKKKLR